MNKFNKAFLSLVIALQLSGCSGWKFYDIESEYRISTTEQPGQANVTTSAEYRNSIYGEKTVALRAPAACLNETHSQATGINQSKDVLLRSTCGEEMSYIERALVEQGIRVISWKVINARVEQSKQTELLAGVTPLEVARELNADYLMVVNSLERTTEVGIIRKWTRSYYRSDKNGSRGESINYSGNKRMWQAVSRVESMEKTLMPTGSIPSANMSVTVTSTRTGEAVWFYDTAKMLTDTRNLPSRAYISKWACDRTGDCKQWGTAAERRQLRRNTTDSHTFSYTVDQTDTQGLHLKKTYDTLIKELIKEMVSSFRSGK